MQAYKAAERDDADTCTCAYCHNCRLARTAVFPTAFLNLLDELGVDPAKDGEVYHVAKIAPGSHLYGDWFHFVGVLNKPELSSWVEIADGCVIKVIAATAPRLHGFNGVQAVELVFHLQAVPWLLAEPEPD